MIELFAKYVAAMSKRWECGWLLGRLLQTIMLEWGLVVESSLPTRPNPSFFDLRSVARRDEKIVPQIKKLKLNYKTFKTQHAIMGQAISTTQFFLYGKRNFTA